MFPFLFFPQLFFVCRLVCDIHGQRVSIDHNHYCRFSFCWLHLFVVVVALICCCVHSLLLFIVLHHGHKTCGVRLVFYGLSNKEYVKAVNDSYSCNDFRCVCFLAFLFLESTAAVHRFSVYRALLKPPFAVASKCVHHMSTHVLHVCKLDAKVLSSIRKSSTFVLY